MCNTCTTPRFFMEQTYWQGNRVSRTYYRIRDRQRIDSRGYALVVASGVNCSDMYDVLRILNEEDARRQPPVCCCTCHQR